jgi:hypothetical protein
VQLKRSAAGLLLEQIWSSALGPSAQVLLLVLSQQAMRCPVQVQEAWVT